MLNFLHDTWAELPPSYQGGLYFDFLYTFEKTGGYITRIVSIADFRAMIVKKLLQLFHISGNACAIKSCQIFLFCNEPAQYFVAGKFEIRRLFEVKFPHFSSDFIIQRRQSFPCSNMNAGERPYAYGVLLFCHCVLLSAYGYDRYKRRLTNALHLYERR